MKNEAMSMIKYPFANPSNTGLLENLHGILHIHSNYQPEDNTYFAAEQHRLTVLSALADTNAAAQFNYQHFIRTMAKMVQKYANKID